MEIITHSHIDLTGEAVYLTSIDKGTGLESPKTEAVLVVGGGGDAMLL